MPQAKADYDSPWKEITRQLFEPFMLFFFPSIHAQIDWSKGYSFQEKEFQKIAYDAETGRRTVDRLVKVRLRGGQRLWLLIHIEIQGKREAQFETRMFMYHYRAFDLHKERILSLAILTDRSPNWRPQQYEHEAFGCRLQFDFPTVKLMDYQDQLGELEQNDNPFALVVLAHLRAQKARGKAKKEFKKQLIRLTWQRGYSKKQTGQLLRVLDWLMILPEDLERELRRELVVEENQYMKQYVTSWERMAKEEGILEGQLKGKLEGELKTLRANIQEILDARFGAPPRVLVKNLEQIGNPEYLRTLLRQAVTCSSIDVFTEQLSMAE